MTYLVERYWSGAAEAMVQAKDPVKAARWSGAFEGAILTLVIVLVISCCAKASQRTWTERPSAPQDTVELVQPTDAGTDSD